MTAWSSVLAHRPTRYRGVTEAGQHCIDGPGSEIRQERASGACSLRASALIEAVARARRRCRSQCGDERHRPPNRALLSYRPNPVAPIRVAGPMTPGGRRAPAAAFLGRRSGGGLSLSRVSTRADRAATAERATSALSSSGTVGARARWLLLVQSGRQAEMTGAGGEHACAATVALTTAVRCGGLPTRAIVEARWLRWSAGWRRGCSGLSGCSGAVAGCRRRTCGEHSLAC
jgi:hypothetical protein